MFHRVSAIYLIFVLMLHSISLAQNLDGKPYTSGINVNIDMYMGSWKESMPKHTHGSLVERDILTKGDPVNPPDKGAILKYINRFTYATLEAHASTTTTTLKGEQEILNILSGKGVIKAGGKTAELCEGIAIFYACRS